MQQDKTEAALTHLKNALLGLVATGPTGFEGFLQTTLSELTGIPFRLAASGLQGGVDGDAVFKEDAVCFEAKRYSGNIQRGEVLTKIADLARNNSAADRLWVLGATIPISTQLANDVRDDGDQHSISTLILDWSDKPLPLLAIAIVAAAPPSIEFLSKNATNIGLNVLRETFEHISAHSAFEPLLSKLKTNLNVSILAVQRSVELHKEWRSGVLNSEQSSREHLGQTLAVLSQSELSAIRSKLRQELQASLQLSHVTVLSGDEGHGKSWLAAQVCSDYEGIALFASAERFDGISIRELDELLIGILIEQTGDKPSEKVNERWRRRLASWKLQPPKCSILLIVDGINQRASLEWAKLINALHARLSAIGGCLLITVRPQFWSKIVAPGLCQDPKVIPVPEWLPEERDRLLEYHSIKRDWLDAATLKTLRNPRLLGVAIKTLPLEDSISWKGLTTDRLLIEHLRSSQRENFEQETFFDLTQRLSEHAEDVLKHASSKGNLTHQFKNDSGAVIESRFFQSLPGPSHKYELREEGLTLALGYTLVDQLWQTDSSGLSLSDRASHLIDPIHAMDRTADVLFAALTICALDNVRFKDSIFSILLDSFSSLQNVSDQRFEEFFGIVREKPDLLFKVLNSICLEPGRRINHDWFVQAVFAFSQTDMGWKITEKIIREWLECYNDDPIEQAKRYWKKDESEYLMQLEKRKEEIEEIRSSLSIFEQNLLSQMNRVSGDTDVLYTLALELLAGRPLAGFAGTFVKLGFAFGLNKDVFFARKAFQQLTTFNRVDREQAAASFTNASKLLKAENTSIVGKWTLVRMLDATGDTASAEEAQKIARKIRPNAGWFGPSSSDKWRGFNPADPESPRPDDLDDGIKSFNSIESGQLLLTMGQTPEDFRFREFLPIACRFQPDLAVQKTRELLSESLFRSGLPLRQLLLNTTEHLPLMTRELAASLINRIKRSDPFHSNDECDIDVLRMSAFQFSAHWLTPEEQAECLTSNVFGMDCLISTIPFLKPQAEQNITESLKAALEANDADAIYGILIAITFGQNSISEELRVLIFRCASSDSSSIRTMAFELALDQDLLEIRQAHVKNGWTCEQQHPRSLENWYGSLLLIKASKLGELSPDSLIMRICPETWFIANKEIGEDVTAIMAPQFLQCIQTTLIDNCDLTIPPVDLSLSAGQRASFPILSVNATSRDYRRFPLPKSPEEIFKDDENFEDKQDRLHAVAKNFIRETNVSGNYLVVQYVTIDDLKSLELYDPDLVLGIVEQLEKQEVAKIGLIRNIALGLANLLSYREPQRAANLLKKILQSQTFLSYTIGDSLTFEHEAIWSSSNSEELRAIWAKRLLMSKDDNELAQEILAAERFGRSDFITEFVEKLVSSNSTLDRAYALTIAGLSGNHDEFTKLIQKHVSNAGITGYAAKRASLEAERATWAGEWLHKATSAESMEDFWQYLMILKTCMDYRIPGDSIQRSKWKAFDFVFRDIRKAAMKETAKNRGKALLGQAVPDTHFVSRSVDSTA
jgi:hypothetical protein